MKQLQIHSILQNAKMGLWHIELDPIDHTGRLYADEVMCHLLGIDQELLPEQAFEVWWKGIQPSYVGYIQDAIDNLSLSKDFEVEYCWQHATKGRRYVRCAGRPLQMTKNLIEIEGYHQDVTNIVYENGDLGKDYTIQDHFKFKKYASNYMHAYQAMYEIDPLTMDIFMVFSQKNTSFTFSDGTNIFEAFKTILQKKDQERFNDWIMHWDKNKSRQVLDLRIDSKWTRIIGSTAFFNQKERWLLCFVDVDEERRMGNVREEKDALMNILSDANTDVFDMDLFNLKVHPMKGEDLSYETFMKKVYDRYSQGEIQKIKDLFAIDHLKTIGQQIKVENLEVQLNEKVSPFSWEKITIIASEKENGHILISIQAMDPNHFVQMIMARYIENNYDILCYIDCRNDLFIPLRVNTFRFDKKVTHSYAEAVNTYIERYVDAPDRAKAKIHMLPTKILDSLKREKIYYFSLGIQDQDQHRQILFQYHYFDKSQDLVLLMITDITEQYLQEQEEKRQMELIRIKASTDHLTGLLNRYACEKEIVEYLTGQGKDEISAFVLIDLDDFKEINDTFGHLVGDQALIDTGQVLTKYFRSTDLISRFGGDEFVVFMKNIKDAGILEKLIHRLLDQLVLLYQNGTNKVELKASIGISIAPRDGMQMESLYRKADKALYRIKKQEKHGYAIYDKVLDQVK